MDLKEKEKLIPEFRRNFNEKVQGVLAEVDNRDVDRIMADDGYAMLFLLWSKSPVQLAVDVAKWRKEYQVNDLDAAAIGESAIKEGNFFAHGRSVNGKRVLYMRGGRLRKSEHEANKRMLVFWLERMQRREQGWESRIVFVMDTTGSSLGNADVTFVKFIIACFTSYFPCLLDKLIVYKLPFLLNSVWRLVSKMLTQEQREGTVLCGANEIHNHIALAQLPADMGGENTFEFSYPPFPDELDVLDD